VRGANPLDTSAPPLPSVSHGPGALYCGKGFGKTIKNTVYTIIYNLVAAATVVTGVFLMVTALTS